MFPQVFSEEREELHATLDSQDTFVRRTSLECQRLRNEATRLNQVLQAKDQVIRWVNVSVCCDAVQQYVHQGASCAVWRMQSEVAAVV